MRVCVCVCLKRRTQILVNILTLPYTTHPHRNFVHESVQRYTLQFSETFNNTDYDTPKLPVLQVSLSVRQGDAGTPSTIVYVFFVCMCMCMCVCVYVCVCVCVCVYVYGFLVCVFYVFYVFFVWRVSFNFIIMLIIERPIIWTYLFFSFEISSYSLFLL